MLEIKYHNTITWMNEHLLQGGKAHARLFHEIMETIPAKLHKRFTKKY